MEEDESITTADEIRSYCRNHYIIPARRNRELVIGIRSGEVHQALSFTNRLPAVCSALGSRQFEEMNEIKRLAIDGPLNGSSTVFVFRLL